MLGDLRPFGAKERRRPRAVELEIEVGDVAVGPDLLAVDVDRADDLVERPVGEVGRLVDGGIVHLGPKRAEALPLRHPPAGEARRL